MCVCVCLVFLLTACFRHHPTVSRADSASHGDQSTDMSKSIRSVSRNRVKPVLKRNRSGKFNDVSGGGNYDEFVMERE